jgi:hypothetical protein
MKYRYEDIRTFGLIDFWTLGHSDIRMQVPGKRPFDTSFGLLRDRFNSKKNIPQVRYLSLSKGAPIEIQ